MTSASKTADIFGKLYKICVPYYNNIYKKLMQEW